MTGALPVHKMGRRVPEQNLSGHSPISHEVPGRRLGGEVHITTILATQESLPGGVHFQFPNGHGRIIRDLIDIVIGVDRFGKAVNAAITECELGQARVSTAETTPGPEASAEVGQVNARLPDARDRGAQVFTLRVVRGVVSACDTEGIRGANDVDNTLPAAGHWVRTRLDLPDTFADGNHVARAILDMRESAPTVLDKSSFLHCDQGHRASHFQTAISRVGRHITGGRRVVVRRVGNLIGAGTNSSGKVIVIGQGIVGRTVEDRPHVLLEDVAAG